MVHWGTQASKSEVRMKRNEEIWSLMGCTSALPFTSNSKEHQNIYGRDDWSKNRNKACKIQTKIFQQPQDIKKSESTSTSHKLQVSIVNENQMIKACTKDHHTRSLTWWKGIRDQTKV